MAAIGGLYVLIDPAACRGRDPVEVTRAALSGGASMIQWRDKQRDKGEQLPDARALYDLCREFDATFIVNDHADLALVLDEGAPSRGAIGVHVGQKDLPLAEVKRIVPAHFRVGVSTNNVAEAQAGGAAGAAYVAVGDLFGTASKSGTRAASVERLAEVQAAVDLPVLGIGGINLDNAALVMAAGAAGVSVISAVCSADDPEAAARALVEAIGARR